MPFVVHRSNRTERLVGALARVVRESLPDPLTPETIVVQGPGMERWLSMQLARALGVWANPSFPFPRKFIHDAMTAVLGSPAPGAAAYEPEALLWSIARLLPELVPRPPFAPLRAYLEDDDRGLKRFQLSARVATILDHYVVYRPELLRTWEQRTGDEWQGILWRSLVDVHGPHHFAARAQELAAKLERGAPLSSPLPARVSLFGLSTLPPLYLDLLQRLAARVEIHLFLLSPSREYWAETRSRRETLRRAQRRDGHLPSEAELLALEGNPLLASLGRLGREFQEVLEALVDYDADDELYADPGERTMLAALQSDILHLAHRGPGGAAGDPARPPPLALAAGDTSIGVHSCHGPMREIEVLHDRLLALFDEDPTLQPRDVVVMTPSIDLYAPYIEAVFRRGADDGSPRIPYRIADRSARASEEIGDAFFRLLDVLRGRLGASEVLDLLAIDAVRARFSLAGEHLDLVRKWITGAGIRWGADAEHRAEAGQPALEQNTWRFGLDRLLLGYALPGGERCLPYGVLPYDDVEGSESEVLGRLADFCDCLFRHRRRLRLPRSAAEWRDELGMLLGEMIASSRFTAHQHQQIRTALAALAERAGGAGFAEPLSLEVMLAELEAELQRGRSARGFLSGGVTFCELVPMRTIPFRVVCLTGMSDTAFPRVRRALSFDEMARTPRRGDRSPREDDRYLFLEALLAARDHLIITHVGQSIGDNSELPPSVVVSELVDTLERSFSVDGGPHALRRRLVTRHPMQPFSPRNFGAGADAPPPGYSAADHRGATALQAARRDGPATPAPFLAAPLALVTSASREIDLEQLARFFERPGRTFLQSRLGLYLGDDRAPLEDREPLVLDKLDEWKIGDTLLHLGGETECAAIALLRARGDLPPGELGDAVFHEIEAIAAAIDESRRRLEAGDPLPPLEIDGAIGDTRLVGTLRQLWPAGRVQVQYSRLGKRHELGCWIRHLALNAFADADPSHRSYLVGQAPSGKKGEARHGMLRFRPVADARVQLAALLDLYWRGLEYPLPLFDGASRAYAEALFGPKPKGSEAALKSARDAFGPAHFAPMADIGDAHLIQLYGREARLDDVRALVGAQDRVPSFEEIARAVFAPLLAHREVLV